MSLKINDVVQTPVVQETKTHQSPSFRKNDYEKSPAQDSFVKKNDDTVKKTAIGIVAALGLAALADGIFAHGKHVKKLFGIAEKDAKNAKPEVKPEPKPDSKPDAKPEGKEPSKPETKPDAPENKDYENWLKEQEEAKKAIEDSNQRNEAWLEAQRSAKEKEYTEFWEKGMSEYEAGLETFTHDGNVFKLAPNGEILSYKNKDGVEQIEKYLNPVTEGDKAYKKIIDNQRDMHLVEQFNSELGVPARDSWFVTNMSLENGKTVVTVTPTTDHLIRDMMSDIPAECPDSIKKELESILRPQFEGLKLSREISGVRDEKAIKNTIEDFQTNLEKMIEDLESNERILALIEKSKHMKAEVKPEPKVVPKPEVKVESKPEVKPEKVVNESYLMTIGNGIYYKISPDGAIHNNSGFGDSFTSHLSIEKGKSYINLEPNVDDLVFACMEDRRFLNRNTCEEIESALKAEFEKLKLSREVADIHDEAAIKQALEDFHINLMKIFNNFKSRYKSASREISKAERMCERYGEYFAKPEHIEQYVRDCGTFTPVDKTVVINGEQVKIIYEGVGVDITADGKLLQKVFVQSSSVAKESVQQERVNIVEQLIEKIERERAHYARVRASSQVSSRKNTNKNKLFA